MFDMLLESSQRPSLLPSWGKGLALTLHVVIVAALWRAPASPAPARSVGYIDVVPPEPTELGPPDIQLPPLDGTICDPAPGTPLDIPVIPSGTLNPPLIGPHSGPQSVPSSTIFGSSDEIYSTAVVQDAPELLSSPIPAYPPLLRAAGVQGQVIVAAVIDTLGQAESGSVRIVLSDNPGFNAPALATVRAARFRPARVFGRAVRVLVQLPVVFRLQ